MNNTSVAESNELIREISSNLVHSNTDLFISLNLKDVEVFSKNTEKSRDIQRTLEECSEERDLTKLKLDKLNEKAIGSNHLDILSKLNKDDADLDATLKSIEREISSMKTKKSEYENLIKEVELKSAAPIEQSPDMLKIQLLRGLGAELLYNDEEPFSNKLLLKSDSRNEVKVIDIDSSQRDIYETTQDFWAFV